MAYFGGFLTTWRSKWCTTNQQIEDAEKKMLSYIKTPYEQKFVKIGEDTYINTIKGGSGEPIVLLHGFGAGIGFWCANFDALAKNNTVYAIDLLGFGRSSRPDIKDIKTPQEAEDYWTDSINKWSNEVGLDKFHLLGHSLGGYLATCFTLKHSEKVKSLLLCDAWGVAQRPIDFEDKLSLPIKLLGRIVTPDMPLGLVRKLGPSIVTRFRPDLLSKFNDIHPSTPDTNKAEPNIIANYIYCSNSKVPATGEKLFTSLSLPLGWAANPLFERLKKIDPSIDITFIYGEHSWIDRSSGYLLQREMKNIKDIIVIDNAGHHVYIDNIEHFHTSVLSSLGNSIILDSKIETLIDATTNNINSRLTSTTTTTTTLLTSHTTEVSEIDLTPKPAPLKDVLF
eukprot:gene3326-4169_t